MNTNFPRFRLNAWAIVATVFIAGCNRDTPENNNVKEQIALLKKYSDICEKLPDKAAFESKRIELDTMKNRYQKLVSQLNAMGAEKKKAAVDLWQVDLGAARNRARQAATRFDKNTRWLVE